MHGLHNYLGGDVVQPREPDESFDLMDSPSYFPCLVMEVGSNHDTLHTLFSKASAWLNVETKTYYVVLFYNQVDEQKLLVSLLGRDGLASQAVKEMSLGKPKISTRESEMIASGKLIRVLAPKRKACLPLDFEPCTSPADIERTYGFKVLHIYELKVGDPVPSGLDFQIDMRQLFRFIKPPCNFGRIKCLPFAPQMYIISNRFRGHQKHLHKDEIKTLSIHGFDGCGRGALGQMSWTWFDNHRQVL